MIENNNTLTGKLKRSLITISPVLLACFFLLIACFWLYYKEWGRFCFFFTGSIIVAMWMPGVIVRQKLDERFDRLESLLKEKQKS